MLKRILVVLFVLLTALPALAGDVVVNPDPFNPGRGAARISYTLENDSDVAIYIFGPGGRLLMKKECDAGKSGGQAGLNQVEWNGKSEFGDTAGRGNYMVRVVKLNDMKLVGSGRMAVIEGYVSKQINPLQALAVLLLVMTGLVAASGTRHLYGLIRRRKK